jgi:hypothetical protein
VFFAPPEKIERVAAAVSRSGGKVLPFLVGRDGVSVIGASG